MNQMEIEDLAYSIVENERSGKYKMEEDEMRVACEKLVATFTPEQLASVVISFCLSLHCAFD